MLSMSFLSNIEDRFHFLTEKYNSNWFIIGMKCNETFGTYETKLCKQCPNQVKIEF